MLYNRQDLVAKLEKGVTDVIFLKKNKEVREMKCTLASRLLPEPKGLCTAENNPDNIVVFDLDKKVWRCFNIQNVISFGEGK